MSDKVILYVGSFVLPDRNAAAQRVIANGLAFRVLLMDTIYFGLDPQVKKTNCLSDTFFRFRGFDCYRRRYPRTAKDWIEYLFSIEAIVRLIAKTNRKVTTIIAYNYPAIALWRLDNYCRAMNMKLISDCTEWHARPNTGLIHKHLKTFDTEFRMRVIHNRLKSILCISQYLAIRYKDTVRNILVVPPLLDKSDAKWEGVASVEDVCFLSRTFVYAGEPGKSKDRLDQILRAFSEVKRLGYSFHFKIIGINRDTLAAVFPEIGSDVSFLGEFISFYGSIPHGEAIGHIKKAEFSIFVRDNNKLVESGFPTKLGESFACGTPVITNNFSDIKNYIQNGQFGFVVDDLSTSKLAETIVDAIEMGGQELKELSAAVVRENPFDYRFYVEGFRIFFDEIEHDQAPKDIE